MDKYEVVRNIGAGSFAVTRLLRNSATYELFAVKYIQRGPAIDDNVAKEIINHRSLRHPNIIRFHEVAVTPTHLAMKMEFAAGGNLLQHIQARVRFSEDEARYYFQQLISGISYCHFMDICHRDLKLENILMDGSPAPRLKICDFGFSTSSLLHAPPRETVGTPTYIAPEVYSRREYNGKLADVWSCGVVLYVMLVGAYPFEKREDPENSDNLIKRILNCEYEIPEFVQICQGCREILSRIFVANPSRRITTKEIRTHPWFLKNLPKELTKAAQEMHFRREAKAPPLQSVEKIMEIVEEARVPPLVSPYIKNVGGDETDDCTNGDNAELAVDDLLEEFDDKIDSPCNLNSGEDIVGARATKLPQESKPVVDNRLKLMFLGDNKDEVVGTRATEFVVAEARKDDRLPITFSTHGADIVGTRATGFVPDKTTKEDSFTFTFSSDGGDIVGTRATKLGEENSLNSASNTLEMDMLEERATELFQSESRKLELQSIIISSSSSEKEDVVGARATKHTFY